MTADELREWVKNRRSGNPRFTQLEDAVLAANLAVVDLHEHCVTCTHCAKAEETPPPEWIRKEGVPLVPFKPIIDSKCEKGKALKAGTKKLSAEALRLAKKAKSA